MASSFASASVLVPMSDGMPPKSRVSTKAVLIGSFVWIALVGGTAYVMEQARRSQLQSVEIPTALSASAPAVPEQPPVRYTNPFDSTEVFEFPPGTSDTQAHHQVAQFLLERARERLGHSQHPTRVASVGVAKSAQ